MVTYCTARHDSIDRVIMRTASPNHRNMAHSTSTNKISHHTQVSLFYRPPRCRKHKQPLTATLHCPPAQQRDDKQLKKPVEEHGATVFLFNTSQPAVRLAGPKRWRTGPRDGTASLALAPVAQKRQLPVGHFWGLSAKSP